MSAISVFGSLILKEANSKSLLLGYIILNHITSRVFLQDFIPPHSRISAESAYMYIHHMCAWCLLGSEEGNLEVELHS